MRVATAVLLTLVVLTSGSPALAAAPVCRVRVDVTDNDPKGTNVRAAPDGHAKAVAVLKNTGDWIEVAIVGQSGDWFEIASAVQVDNNAPADKTIFRGHGFLHKSVVGLSGLQQGTTIYADHDVKSRVLVASAAGDQTTQFLGCWGDFYKVNVQNITGWTKEVCTNMNTTCA